MNRSLLVRGTWTLALASINFIASPAFADEYDDTVNVFMQAIPSSHVFDSAYGYAVFPTVGKGGLFFGGGYGKGRVYEQGRYIGDTAVTQLTLGLQAGGQAFSQIVFFQDRRALDEFTRGNFEFGAQASAVAITAAAQAQAGTAGTSAGASGSQQNATTVATYNNGMATYTVAKGGFMTQATIGGERFSYAPR